VQQDLTTALMMFLYHQGYSGLQELQKDAPQQILGHPNVCMQQ
jgi:hypothetical protein